MKDKFKSIGWVAIYLLAFLGIEFLTVLVISFSCVIMGFLLSATKANSSLFEIVTKLMSDPDYLFIVSALINVVALVAFAGWYYAREKKIGFHPDYATTLNGKNVLKIALCGLLGQYATDVIIIGYFHFFPSLESQYSELMDKLAGDNFPILSFILVAIVAPILEEFVFRGMIFCKLRRSFSFWPAALISAVLFGLFHMNVVQGTYAFILGIAMAYLVEHTDTILASMFLHGVLNASSYIKDGCESMLYENGIVLPTFVIIIISLVAAAALILILRTMKRKPPVFLTDAIQNDNIS